jgi:hypothetical protein
VATTHTLLYSFNTLMLRGRITKPPLRRCINCQQIELDLYSTLTRKVIANCTFPEFGDICRIQRLGCYAFDVVFNLGRVNYNALGQYHRHSRIVAKVIGVDGSSF